MDNPCKAGTDSRVRADPSVTNRVLLVNFRPAVAYSKRRTSIGSIRVARRAGK